MKSRVEIEIDSESGFCFGVTSAIRKAEDTLADDGCLYCLGDIVHNSDEVERLRSKGLVTITHGDLEKLHDVKVLLRAHGEPPSTYEIARRNNITIIDATCPVVLRLQRSIAEAYASGRKIVIYGKPGHAEVNGLVGQTRGNATVVEHTSDLDNIDFTSPLALFSQTTKSQSGFSEMCVTARSRGEDVETHDTICRWVANRGTHLSDFARTHDVVVFVAGSKSSNGKVLFGRCREANSATFAVENASQLRPEWFRGAGKVGICGATSTPRWLMEEVQEAIDSMVNRDPQ